MRCVHIHMYVSAVVRKLDRMVYGFSFIKLRVLDNTIVQFVCSKCAFINFQKSISNETDDGIALNNGASSGI